MLIDHFSDNFQTLYVYRKTSQDNEIGNSVTTFTLNETFQGLLNLANTQEMLLADKINEKTTHKMYCSTSVDINKNDEIRDSEGNRYDIVGDIKNTFGLNDHYKIMLNKSHIKSQ